jgi:hypothetical protein
MSLFGVFEKAVAELVREAVLRQYLVVLSVDHLTLVFVVGCPLLLLAQVAFN